MKRASGTLVRIVVWAVLLLAVMLPSGPVWAQGGPTMEVRPGFDGYAPDTGWIPIQVILANDGPDLEGLVQVQHTPTTMGATTLFQRPVSLPTQSRKRIWLYVPASIVQREVPVQLVVDGQVLIEVNADLDIVRQRDYLVGVVSAEPSAFNLFTGLPVQKDARLRVAALTPDDLPPEGRAWDALDALVVHDADWNRWDRFQLEAVSNWVAMGGHLVVTSGPLGFATAPGELAVLLPVPTGGGTVTVDSLPGLEEFTDASLGSAGPFVVARTGPGLGGILLQEGDLVLLARRTHGAGLVDGLALDPALEPLRGWIGSEALWDRILKPVDASRPQLLMDTLGSDPTGLYDLPNLGLPSVWQLVLFLLAYIVVIGPVNYVVLWRLKRRELAWFTIPAIALLFAGLAYGTGFRLRGERVIAYELNVIHARSGVWAGDQTADSVPTVAAVESFVGIFSPRRTAYEVSLPGTPLVDVARRGGPAGPRVNQAIVEGDPTLLPDVRVDVGAVRAFRATTTMPWTPVEANLTVTTAATQTSARTRRVGGSLRNATGVAMKDCVIVWRGSALRLGDLDPGESKAVKHVFIPSSQTGTMPVPASSSMVQAIAGGNPWNNPDLQGRYTTLTTLFGWDDSRWQYIWDDLYLVGWAEVPVVEAEVAGQTVDHRQTTLIFVELPYQSDSSGESYIPPEQIVRRVVREGGDYEVMADGYGFQQGTYVLEYELPGAVQDLDVTELFLQVRVEGLPAVVQQVSFSLLEWDRDQWLEIDVSSGEVSISSPERYVSSEGVVQLQIVTDQYIYVRGPDISVVGNR